jgi:hypothetical protein
MDISSFKGHFESMFTDEVDVFLYIPTKGADGSTSIARSDTASLEKVKCKLIYKSLESPADKTDDANPVELIPRVLFPLNTSIKAGDYLVVNKKASDGTVLATYSGDAGLPGIYATHQEVFLQIKGTA